MPARMVRVFWRGLRARPEKLVCNTSNGKYVGIKPKTYFSMTTELYHHGTDPGKIQKAIAISLYEVQPPAISDAAPRVVTESTVTKLGPPAALIPLMLISATRRWRYKVKSAPDKNTFPGRPRRVNRIRFPSREQGRKRDAELGATLLRGDD